MWVQVSVLRTTLERTPSASKLLELLRRPGDPSVLQMRGAALGAAWMLAACTWGCGDATGAAARPCAPGETRVCAGAAACPGAQACAADGQGFGACDCGPGAPDAGASEPDAGQLLARHQLAASCQTDRDCGRDLFCWSSSAQSFFGRAGGVAGGYCTAACETAAQCTAFDARAGCGDGLCFLGCFSGEAAPGEGKCRERGDLACWSIATLGLQAFDPRVRQAGICLPLCGSDEDCAGRACDLATGLCVDAPSTGAAIGAACERDEQCAGRVCQASRVAGASFCSAPCSFGALGCGYGGNAQPRGATCLTPATFDENGSEGVGDVGLCLELCDQAADCAQPGWQCAPVPDAVGRTGFCTAPSGDAGVDGGSP
jgi:hypothetical protein